MSDYSSSSSDYEDEPPPQPEKPVGEDGPKPDDFDSDTDEVPRRHEPVPMSKNAGNRFVAVVYDSRLDNNGRDWEEMFENRTALTEDHVRWCREANLYDDTSPNRDSDVDVMYSYQM